MAFITKAFGQFYKLFNPKNIPEKNWYTASFVPLFEAGQFENGTRYSSSYGPMSASYIASGKKFWLFSSSFINYPGDPVVVDGRGRSITGYSYLSTRYVSASHFFKDKSSNPISMSVVPWGSQAGDFLWNVATPSWSFREDNLEGDDYITWTPAWTSKSFHSLNALNGHLFGIGTSSVYPVTSSWKVFDPKYITFQYPSYVFPNASEIGSPQPGGLSLQLAFATYSSCYKIHVDQNGLVGQAAGLLPNTDIDFFNEVNNAVFDLGGGVAITQAEVSQSMAIVAVSGSTNTQSARRAVDRALRQRRLYFPITYATASGYWLKQFTGFAANEMFTENGGIYNVRFTLKRWNKAWVASDSASYSGSVGNVFYDPNTSDLEYNTGSWDMSTAYPAVGSYMNIFIHDVLSTTPQPSQRVAGAPGWYPPATNIVTIGNGYETTPVMSFIDGETGLIQEKFDIILVQYGWPAQLCFEPSGSAQAPFGCIIDDIEVCKIGVTTDPRFIKPQTTAYQSSQAGGATPGELTVALSELSS
jgi:hypothetical protein